MCSFFLALWQHTLASCVYECGFWSCVCLVSVSPFRTLSMFSVYHSFPCICSLLSAVISSCLIAERHLSAFIFLPHFPLIQERFTAFLSPRPKRVAPPEESISSLETQATQTQTVGSHMFSSSSLHLLCVFSSYSLRPFATSFIAMHQYQYGFCASLSCSARSFSSLLFASLCHSMPCPNMPPACLHISSAPGGILLIHSSFCLLFMSALSISEV